jgi:hypothetical protein
MLREEIQEGKFCAALRALRSALNQKYDLKTC